MKPQHSFISRVLVAALLVFLSLPAFAQHVEPAPAGTEEEDRGISIGVGPSSPVAGADIVAEQAARIADIRQRTSRAEARLMANAEDDAVLVEIRNELDVLARELIASGVAFRPRLAAINDRLEEIGPAPVEGSPPEPEALSLERQSLQNEKAEINALLGEAEALSLRINRMLEEVVQIRRDLFANTLSRRYDVWEALSPVVLAEFAAENRRLHQAVSSWARFVYNYKAQAALLATGLALAAALMLLIGGRMAFGKLIVADPDNENPSYLSRLSVAFWSTLLPSAALALFLFATYYFYTAYGVLRTDISRMMVTLFNVIATVFFVYRLSRAVFSPNLPNWRLLPIQSRAARILFWLFWLTALVTGLDFVMSRVNDVMGSPLSLTVAKSLVATIIVGLLVLLIGTVKPFVDETGAPRRWHPAFRWLLYLLGGGTILAALLGYIGLARFISQQIVITGAIVTTMYIGHLSARAISDIGAFTNTSLGRRLDKRFNLDETREDQFGLLFSVIINLIVLSVGVPLILLQWGFQWGDLQAWAYDFATEIRIGTITISIVGILSGIAIFLAGFFVTRVFQRWLDAKVMSRGRIDMGVRNSISMVVGYAGLALAAVIGISATGLDLSNLALVAGALSVGIGFGLQNIVNNFVSGLILLAERPFKVGDWIVAGGVEGTVKKISVRATEVETFQRQSVILPNSELINSGVGNWTHRNKLGRVDINLGVTYDSDPRHVHDLLLKVVSGHQGVLKNPAPMVAFTNFGTSALEFSVRFFLPDISSQVATVNEMRFRIFEALRAEGIAIPVPPLDASVKSRSPAEIAAPIAEIAPRKAAAKLGTA
jgi:potassium-dependent mechanosensitive channel